MTPRLIHRTARYLCGVLLCALLLTACATQPDPLAWRRAVVQTLRANLALPLTARLQPMPADLLATVQRQDRALGIDGVELYGTRPATAMEQELFAAYLGLLPPAHRRVFADKLLGVFIVDNFAGAGLTEWVVDGQGQVYYYLILNGALFSQPLDTWLSHKEDSLFAAGQVVTVQVRSGTAYRALLYGLLHEGAHIVDFELGVTPFVEEEHRKVIGRMVEVTPFTADVWLQQDQPEARYDFSHRKDINIYGIFARRGLIAREQLPVMFAQLRTTPFASFYSGVSWNEHLADYLTNYHLEKVLGGSITFELVQDGQVVSRHTPVRTPQAVAKEPTLRVFYR